MNADFYNAAEHALANYFGIDEFNQELIELVGDCMFEAVQQLPNWAYYNNLLQKASTYLQTDMNDLELNDFVGELEEQLEAYGLV